MLPNPQNGYASTLVTTTIRVALVKGLEAIHASAGDCLDCSPAAARVLLAEGWAILLDPAPLPGLAEALPGSSAVTLERVAPGDLKGLVTTVRTQHHRGHALFFDLTDVEAGVRPSDLRNLADDLARETRIAAFDGRMALFAPSDAIYSVARTLGAYCELSGFNRIAVFRSCSEADAWLLTGTPRLQDSFPRLLVFPDDHARARPN